MGGRGNMMKPLNERIQQFKATGIIEGIKVLEPIKKRGKRPWHLPSMSNTPNTNYIKLTKTGDIAAIQHYGADRLPTIRIDFTHDHGKGNPHVELYEKGNETGISRSMNLAEIKEYGKILKKFGKKP